MMALTSCGRASAISQPNGPDCECVSTIAGPILSSSAAPASWLRCCVSSTGDHGLDLRRVERVEHRIALLALFRALRPAIACASSPAAKLPLTRCGELELLIRRGEHASRAVARMPGGAAAHRLIDHVDDVALLDEILGPALAPVRRSHPVGRGLRGAMDQHKRIGSAHVLGREHLDVDLALHDLLAGLADIFSADIEIAALATADWSTAGTGSLGGSARVIAGTNASVVRTKP